MSTITNNVRWASNTAELAANLKQGLDQIEATRAGAEKMVQTLSGDRLIAAAHKTVAAITQIGGASKLTAAEAERNFNLIERAIQKMELTSKTVPTAMLEMRDALRDVAHAQDDASHATGGWLPLLHELGTSWVARIAEGILLRDAIRDIIGKIREMAAALPEIALKGAAVADVEENFKRLTAQAGLLGDKLMGTLREGTHNTVDNFELMKTVNRDLAAGMVLTDKQFGTLAKGAFALAQATGVDVKQAFDTMNDAMLTGRTRSLAELTGKIQTTAAEEKFAAAMKHSADQLTEEGKLQAARAAILDAVAASTERLGEQVDGLDERVAQAGVAWSNFKDDIGKAIATSAVLEAGMAGVKDELQKAFGGEQESLIKAIARSIDSMAITLLSFAETGVKGVGFIGIEFNALKVVAYDVVQIFEDLNLAAAKLTRLKLKSSDILGIDPQTQAQIKIVSQDIDDMGARIKARGQSIQDAKAGEEAWRKKGEELAAAIKAIKERMEEAAKGTAAFIGPIQQSSEANSAAARNAGAHWDALFKLNEEQKRLEKTIADLNSANVALNETDQIVVITQHARGMGEADLAKYIHATADQVRATIKADEERTKEAQALADVRRSIEKTGNEQSLKEYEKWAAGVSKAADDVGKHIVDGAVQIGTAEKELADILAKQGLSAWDYQVVKIQEWATSAKGAFKGTADQAKAFYDLIDQEAKAKIDAIDSDWDTLKTHSTASLQHTADLAAATYDYMLEHSDEFSAGTIEHFKKIAEAAQDAADGTQHAWINAFTRIGEQIPALVQQAFTGGGGLAGAGRAAGSLVGSELGKGLVAHLTEESPDFMGSALGKVFGAAIPAIGALAGPLISAIIKLFDHLGDDIARDAGEKFGTHFSEATAKAIEDDFHNGLTEVAAELNNLDKIIADMGGITAQNVDRVTARFHDLFSMLQTGQLTAAQVNRQLTAGFPALQKASTDALGRWSDGLKEIIRLDQAAETHNEAIAAALKEQGSNALTAFTAVTAGMLSEDKIKVWDDLKKKVDDATEAQKKAAESGDTRGATQAALDLKDAIAQQAAGADLAKSGLKDLGIQAVATFAAAVASGMSEEDALKAIHPALQSLTHAYEDLGISTDDAALKALMMRDKIATAAPALMSGISGLSSEMTALNNMGLLNATTFGAMERTGKSMFDQLSAKVKELGGTDADALGPMQTFLHNAEKAAKDLGIPVDDDIAKMIEASKKAGIWQDAMTPEQKMLEGMQTLIDKVNDLIDALRGIPPKVKTTVTVDTQHTGDTGGGGSDGTDSGTTRAATGGRITRSGLVPVPQYFAFGGNVLPFHPKGTDTVPAMLTPGELVLTPPAALAYEQMMNGWVAGDDVRPSPQPLPGLAATGTDGPGGTLRIALVLDGREITSTVIKHVRFNKPLPGGSRAGTEARGAWGLPS